jgi:hypothetical protein
VVSSFRRIIEKFLFLGFSFGIRDFFWGTSWSSSFHGVILFRPFYFSLSPSFLNFIPKFLSFEAFTPVSFPFFLVVRVFPAFATMRFVHDFFLFMEDVSVAPYIVFSLYFTSCLDWVEYLF